jgi:hypothetical protein
MAKKTWKQMTSIAPKTNHNAFRFPSLWFTLAAVILINPGGIIPIIALIKPKNKGVI